jgi:peptidoglycan hydrolase-like protein with peptidoglycan-binding domain
MSHTRRTLARGALALAAAGLLLGASVPPTYAYSAAYPHLRGGDRGTDVKALQYLLEYRGYRVKATGVFDPGTQAAVVAFERRIGIRADGVVTGPTWARLVTQLGFGRRNNAVRAVQVLLNEKRGADLPVTGWFGPMTRSAIRHFQDRSGLGVDGVVGPVTWRYLLGHFEQPFFPAAAVCGYATGANGHAAHWGRPAAVTTVERAILWVYRAGHGPVSVGDISRVYPGQIAGHNQHRHGLDFDIRPMRTAENQCSTGVAWYRWSNGTKVCCNPAYDRSATRALVKAIRLAAGRNLKQIAFNDPQLVREGLTRHFAGHDDHLHVTICEPMHPEAYYRC